MLQGHDIVCFANDWESDPLSKKHIMTRLARHNRVLWVSSLGYRRPRPTARDFRRAVEKLRRISRGLRRVDRNLWVWSPLVLPFHGNPAARRINQRWLERSLGRVVRRLGMRHPITWAFEPSSADVVGTLGERLTVYHCVDEFSELPGADGAAIAAMEAKLLERCDLVLVSAGPLLEDKRRKNPNTFLVTHGVDVAHFRRALARDTPPPAELASLPRPVIGFFGLIADWVDLELVAFVARERPEWSIVMIGKVDTDTAPLDGVPNVHLLGWREYRSLPGWCRGFDVAMLPFRVNRLTVAANPLKLREYLAAGLPVVATAIPEAERLAPSVRIARSREEFVREIDRVLARGDTGPSLARSHAMDGETWDHKVEELSRVVGSFLERAPRAPGPARVGGLARAAP
ncbi:MAG TPA: glycosyltransferase [Thermoanaerobaculia bacterium]|nr:glycosyltransferase [Thermoanaerobaculia bacterium]